MNQTAESTHLCLDPGTPGIRAHACIKHIPPWEDDDPRFTALLSHVEQGAPLLPVQMTNRNEIADAESYNRWRVARAMHLEEMPVLIVEDDRIATTALASLLHRNHWTKSARAYLAWPLLEKAFAESRHRRLENLKKGQCFSESGAAPLSGNTVQDFATKLGFDRHTFFDAKKVHEIFIRDAEYKAQMEPRILAEPIGGEHEDKRPVGLGAVIAGWGGRKNLDQTRKDRQQLELFTDSVGTLFKRFVYWTGFDAAARKIALQEIRDDIAKLPPEHCSGLADLLRTIAKEASQRGGVA